MSHFTLERIGYPLAIARLGATESIPAWAGTSECEFVSITRTRAELSIVCDARRVPADTLAERDWSALKVVGPLSFDQVGIIAALSGTLRDAGLPIFVVSTYDTDYLLVRERDAEMAASALESAGHRIR